MAKIKSIKKISVQFQDVKAWFEQNMHPNVIDFNDQKPYEIYEKGHFAGVFQCLDEDTHVLMSDQSQKAIKNVEIGDQIVTFDEISQKFIVSTVEQLYDQGEKDCIELKFDNGEKLICTADHLILTQRGWIQAGELTNLDTVVSLDSKKLVSSRHVGKRHVYDIEVKDTHNFVANKIVVHNCTSSGAQKFFVRSTPKSIVDIAALTSIYRPGPLAADVDKLWMKHVDQPYDWGSDLINETLKDTRGLLVFQESVMFLANKVAGFPLEQCDEVRRAIMKRSISGGEAAKQKAQDMENDFVAGSVKNGVPENIAKKAYQTILWMSGYAFNRSHAVAYAINSFYCAWLLTYYPEQWLTSYLEAMSSSPENKAEAASDIKKIGYKIVQIDINKAGFGWTALPNKEFMPSLLTVKSLGKSAAEEIMQNRPYTDIESMLWNSDGMWRHSKFNSAALSALIEIGAFKSMDIVGEDKLFSSYAHMYEVLVNNIDKCKKTSKKDPFIGKKNFYDLVRETRDVELWTSQEVAMKHVDRLGSVDPAMLVDPDILEVLESRSVKNIDSFDVTDVYWFIVMKAIQKTSKNKSKYMLLECLGNTGKTHKMFVWAWNDEMIKPYTLCYAEVSQSDFGMQAQAKKLKILT